MHNDLTSRYRLRRTELLGSVEGILEAAIDAGRNLTTDEESRVAAAEAELKGIETQIARAGRVDAFNAIKDQPAAGVQPHKMALTDGPGTVIQRATSTPAAGRSPLFSEEARRDFGAFRDAGDFWRAAFNRNGDSRLDRRSMTEGTPSGGGFAVPSAVASTIIGGALEQSVLAGRCTSYEVRGDSLRIAAWDSEDRSSTTFGGIQTSWTAEGATFTEHDPTMRAVTLKPSKLLAATSFTRELAQDGIDGFVAALESALRQALGFELDYAVLRGDGVGKPSGVLSSGATITVEKESGQAPTTLVPSNLSRMFSSMLPSSISRAIWVCSPSAVHELARLSEVVGAGGYEWRATTMDASGITIMGRPCFVSEKASQLGTVGDILFVDPLAYALGISQDLRIETSMHALWSFDKVAIRATLRADGCSLLDSPVTPRVGTASSLSPFVTLAARA